MSKVFLSAFVGCIGIGLVTASLPRLIAPSDTYISDTLGINDEFYITAEPTSQTVTAGDIVTFIISTNHAVDVDYQWQMSSDTGVSWSDVELLGSDRDIFRFTSSGALDGFLYRCLCSYGDTTLFSVPVVLSVLAEQLPTEETTTAVQEEITTEPEGGVIENG